jgi:hypothetical protein
VQCVGFHEKDAKRSENEGQLQELCMYPVREDLRLHGDKVKIKGVVSVCDGETM